MSAIKNSFGQVSTIWKNLRFPFKLIIISSFIIILGVTGYYMTGFILSTPDEEQIEVSTQVNRSVTLVPPSPIPPKYSPINGVEIANSDYDSVLSRHPVAVVVNNHKEARPQSGLSFADSVLEVLAEGGITRYVALYHNNYEVEKVGPIRSLRYYMIDFASGYSDAIILHHGWAGFDGASFEHYNERTDARGAISKFGVKNIHTEASTYRDTQKAKTAGYVHSLYTDFGRINSEINRLSKASNWKLGIRDLESLKFKDDAEIGDRGVVSSIDIKFMSLGGSDYNSRFVYDRESNNYPRFIGGVADIDALTNKQIAPKNVVVEWHNYADAKDGHSRIVIDMIGKDKATILRDGDIIEGEWRKDCRLCRTKYYDLQGEEISFNRGQIWIVNAVKVQDRLISTVTIE